MAINDDGWPTQGKLAVYPDIIIQQKGAARVAVDVDVSALPPLW